LAQHLLYYVFDGYQARNFCKTVYHQKQVLLGLDKCLQHVIQLPVFINIMNRFMHQLRYTGMTLDIYQIFDIEDASRRVAVANKYRKPGVPAFVQFIQKYRTQYIIIAHAFYHASGRHYIMYRFIAKTKRVFYNPK